MSHHNTLAPELNVAAPLLGSEMSVANVRIAAQVDEVRRIVREKSGLDLSVPEIVRVHLLSIEPTSLAKSIVFSLTGNVLDLAEDGDDEREVGNAGRPGVSRAASELS